MIAQHEFKGTVYYAVIPVENLVQEEDGFCEYVILKEEVDESGELSLVSVDDDDEFDDIADCFDDMFSEEIDYDEKK